MGKSYDKEFKLQTVRMIQGDGKPVAQVACELGIHENTLYRWMAEYKQSAGRLKPDDKAIREMQKRIRDLEEENEILKKAIYYFTKNRR